MDIDTINSLKKKVNEMIKNSYNWKIEDEEIYTIICELEKQSKEIDQLKKEVIHWKGNYHLLSRKIDVISKDKIKSKIEELEIEQKNNRQDLKFAIDNLIFSKIDKIADKISINMSVRDMLLSLLEEE